MFHAIKTLKELIIMIFSFALTLRNAAIRIEKNIKRKINKLLMKYRFNEFITLNCKRRNNMN